MLVIGAVVVDWFRLGAGMESVGYVNLAFVWLFAQQLGFAYADGSFTRLTRRTLWVTVIGVFATLAVLTSWGPYPVSMVGLPCETSNMTPPTICLSTLAVAQVAIMMLIRGTVSGWLERPAPWTAVVRFASMAMTAYLWHLSILVIAFLALFGLGIDPSRRIRALVADQAVLVIRSGPGPVGRRDRTRIARARQSSHGETGDDTLHHVLAGFASSAAAARWSRH